MNDTPTTPEAIWAASIAKDILRGMDLADGADDGLILYEHAFPYLERMIRDAVEARQMDRADALIRARLSIRNSHEKNPESRYFRIDDALIDKEFSVNEGTVRLELSHYGVHMEIEVPSSK